MVGILQTQYARVFVRTKCVFVGQPNVHTYFVCSMFAFLTCAHAKSYCIGHNTCEGHNKQTTMLQQSTDAHFIVKQYLFLLYNCMYKEFKTYETNYLPSKEKDKTRRNNKKQDKYYNSIRNFALR